MEKQYCVYIMTNKLNTVLYTGITGYLEGRVFQHRQKKIKGFTKRYNEVFPDPRSAIAREKQIKAGSRRKNIELINSLNPELRDLYEGL